MANTISGRLYKLAGYAQDFCKVLKEQGRLERVMQAHGIGATDMVRFNGLVRSGKKTETLSQYVLEEREVGSFIDFYATKEDAPGFLATLTTGTKVFKTEDILHEIFRMVNGVARETLILSQGKEAKELKKQAPKESKQETDLLQYGAWCAMDAFQVGKMHEDDKEGDKASPFAKNGEAFNNRNHALEFSQEVERRVVALRPEETKKKGLSIVLQASDIRYPECIVRNCDGTPGKPADVYWTSVLEYKRQAKDQENQR